MSKVVNFGCRLNNFEGKKIEELLANNNENMVVINSCAVTNETERQVRQTIRKIKKEYPDKKIVMTGCAAQISPDKYSSMTEVDKVIDNISKLKSETWTSLLDEELEVDFKEDIFDSPQDIRPSLDNKNLNIRESLVIQQGCNHRCTFCIIPFGRGNNRSFDPFYLIDEVERVVENGVKEIVLTGVDISDYGSDFDHKYNMSNLILDILDKTKLQRLRLSSIDCVEVDENFNEVLKDQRVMPHLHLSIQSGDDMILKRMKRRHNSKDVFQFVDRCKKIRKDISFGADIIAGFPTETEEMFKDSVKLIDDCHLTHLHVFPYSPRENTPAARMPQVDKTTIKNRAKILREKALTNLKKHLTNKIGKKDLILVEKNEDKKSLGKDQNYLIVVINEVVNEGNIIPCIYTGVENNKLLAKRI